MKTFSKLLLLTAFVFVGCGGGPTREFRLVERPTDMAVSKTDITFDGRTSRVIYVSSLDSGTVSVLDQRNENFVDTDLGDDFDDSPIIVGGKPVAVAVDDRGDVPRLFVADASTNQLFAFDASPPAESSQRRLAHESVDLRGEPVTRASRPIFQDRGRRSTPAFSEITVTSEATPQSWDFQYRGEGKGYRVRGSVAGELEAIVYENEDTSLQNESLNFSIRSGGESTTTNDRFRFGVNLVIPLDLPGRPTDLLVLGNRLLITVVDPGSLVIFDLDSLSISTTIALNGGNARPSFFVASDELAYVNDLASTSIYQVNLSSSAISEIDTGKTIEALGIDATLTDRLFLFPQSVRELNVLRISDATIVKTIFLNSFGLGFEPYTFEEERRALISTVAGDVEVLDMASLERVDTRDNSSDTESDYLADEFFDAGPTSGPSLISVNTRDGVTRSERWQVIYEGFLPGANALTGTVSGDQIELDSADTGSLGVQVGDTVMISGEEVSVAEVTASDALRLESTPSVQGATTVSIRTTGSYMVIGSLSGAQSNRVVENEPYLSDGEDIALTIRSSVTQPTTRGDYFTFLTVDGTDPIYTGGKRISRSPKVFTRPFEDKPTAYVVHEGNDSVSALNLDNLRERKVIR